MSVIAEENVDEYNQPTETESLCMNCYQNEMNREVDSATTRILELDFEIPAYTQKGCNFSSLVKLCGALCADQRESETCSILIPELEFEFGMAVVGGKFTTLEGLLKDIKDLIVSKNLFTCGDSSTSDRTEKLKLFGQKMDKVKSGGATEELGTKITFHLTDMSRDLLKIMAGDMDVLDDPAGNRYLQNVYAPDPEMTTEKYTRTFEKNEDLGLNDMKTDGYQE